MFTWRPAASLAVSIEESTRGVGEWVETGVWLNTGSKVFWKAYRDTCLNALELSDTSHSDTLKRSGVRGDWVVPEAGGDGGPVPGEPTPSVQFICVSFTPQNYGTFPVSDLDFGEFKRTLESARSVAFASALNKSEARSLTHPLSKI